MQTQSYLKASIDGLNGSGKTGTAARLAVGLSIEYADRAPVIVYDSEERWRFLKPVIFDRERVPLIIIAGKSLVTLREAQDRAESEGAGVFVGDQLTTPWMEGLKAFSYENGSLPFDRRQQLMNQWEPVIDNFRYGRFHAVCCGRLGYNWSKVEDENGDLQLLQGDSKFNAGGGNNFGYEADLELEMRRRKRSIVGLFRGKTSVEHVCDVVKDAAAGILSGQQFVFSGQQGVYKPGDYKQVLDAFRPYLEFMREVPPPEPNRQSTKQLLVSGKTAWAKDQTDRTCHLENISGLFDYCFGSQQSTTGKMFRNLTLEFWGYGWSWSHMEESALLQNLEKHVAVMQAMRRRIEQKQMPTDYNAMLMLLKLSTDDALYQGSHYKGMTLFEAMGLESIAEVATKKKRGQPVVDIMDRIARDEVATGD